MLHLLMSMFVDLHDGPSQVVTFTWRFFALSSLLGFVRKISSILYLRILLHLSPPMSSFVINAHHFSSYSAIVLLWDAINSSFSAMEHSFSSYSSIALRCKLIIFSLSARALSKLSLGFLYNYETLSSFDLPVGSFFV